MLHGPLLVQQLPRTLTLSAYRLQLHTLNLLSQQRKAQIYAQLENGRC